MKTFLLTMMVSFSAFAARPAVYTELLDYVIAAPDQGESATCIYVGSTGAMEILANKKYDLKHQMPGDRFDISERFLIWQKSWNTPGDRVEAQIRKFNWGEAVHISDLPFNAYNPDGTYDSRVWNKPPAFSQLPRIKVPKIETKKIFVRGGKWDTFVLKPGDVELIKQTLWNTKSPVLINYNDTTAGGNYGTDAVAAGQNKFVTMTVTVIPEPSSVALLGTLGAMLLFRRRR